MILLFIMIFCTITALGFGAAAAWSDFNSLKIPNIYSLFIDGAFLLAFAVHFINADKISFFGSWQNHFIAGLVMFTITLVLFFAGKLGGGDAKLISAFALWTGLSGLMPFLFMMAIIGGLLAAITLYLNKNERVKEPSSLWIKSAQAGERKVPYGIAIFGGAVFAFWHTGYIRPAQIIDIAKTITGVAA